MGELLMKYCNLYQIFYFLMNRQFLKSCSCTDDMFTPCGTLCIRRVYPNHLTDIISAYIIYKDSSAFRSGSDRGDVH